MSQALDYLLQARPDAMQAYFTFLKNAGRRLNSAGVLHGGKAAFEIGDEVADVLQTNVES